MLAKILSSSIYGLEALLVNVEVDVTAGLPTFLIVGLPDISVKESRERIKSAIKNCGYQFPVKQVTINLAPADIKKEGPYFDLPMAIGILSATGVISRKEIDDFLIMGELSLDGSIRPIKGALSMSVKAREAKLKGFILSQDNSREAAIVEGVDIYPVSNLPEAVEFLNGRRPITPYKVDPMNLFLERSQYDIGFQDVKGQTHVKRALEVAVAGGHNIIMIGPPGSGKTMLAKRLPTILPPMTFEEAIETTKINSIAGVFNSKKGLTAVRPFRAPHHTISNAGLVGGGTYPMPGEISLAHNGVLFLDELLEFQRNVLDVLRQPMEDGLVTISRASHSLTYPARFMLAAAMNPCPCGYFTDQFKECTCTPLQIQRYLSKISGPLMDRIDIHIEVPSVKYRELASPHPSENSEVIRERVAKAREIQLERLKGEKIYCNAQMGSQKIRKYCSISEDSENLLEMAIDRLGFSARAHDRILKVARTIADLEGASCIEANHISEAIQYRSLDRYPWNR